jgi:hypothetical protein
VTTLTGVVQIVACVPELLDVLALHDVKHFEPDVAHASIRAFQLNGIFFKLRLDLIGRQFNSIGPVLLFRSPAV